MTLDPIKKNKSWQDLGKHFGRKVLEVFLMRILVPLKYFIFSKFADTYFTQATLNTQVLIQCTVEPPFSEQPRDQSKGPQNIFFIMAWNSRTTLWRRKRSADGRLISEQSADSIACFEESSGLNSDGCPIMDESPLSEQTNSALSLSFSEPTPGEAELCNFRANIHLQNEPFET